MHLYVKTVATTIVLGALVACGGGSSGGNSTPPPSDPPPANPPPANPPPSDPPPSDPPPANPPPSDPSLGLDARPANLTCEAPPLQANGTTEIALEEVFADIAFSQPLGLLQAPGDASRWFVLEKPGRITVVTVDAAGDVLDVAEFMDLDDHFSVDDRSEGGLLGMAFHPDFEANGAVFLSWTEGPPMVSVVARFDTPDGTSLDPASRTDLIRLDQPFENHNGGHIAFGPDGHLYIGFGDGGSGGDPDGHAQDTTDLLGAFLRLDVDGGAPYAIPTDNPFAGNAHCTADPNVSAADCPEIFAWGVRNPWRWSFDAETGELWAGDVGQGSREEVDRIELGGNYGWDCREGLLAFSGTPAASCSTATGLIDPVHDYPRAEGSSITGGYVYRGSRLPALVGSYVFGDYGSGRIWRLVAEGAGGVVAEELLDTNLSIVSFAEGLDGELYVVDIAGGLHRIVAEAGAAPSDPSAAPVAGVLSATGCVDSADPRLPAPGLIPYEVAAGFWSDGASKERWLAIPDGQTLSVEADGDFSFPNGSVLMKHFRLADRLVETRLFMRHPEGEWAGYSYRWNDEQTDAVLVEGGAVADVEGQSWIFPSADDCMICHTSAAGFALGPEAAQLDHALTYPSTGRTANQLATLSGIGLTASPLTPPAHALVDPYDETLSIDARARALLHTNCAQCHRSGGPAPGAMDLRFNLTLDETNACNAIPEAGDLGLGAAARIVVPGDPDLSVLVSRMGRRDAHGMPPLASNLVDAEGVAVVRAWIASLDGC